MCSKSSSPLSGNRRLEADEALVESPQEHADRMVLLLRGQLEVYENNPSGGELTLAALEARYRSGRQAMCGLIGGSWVCWRWSPPSKIRRSSDARVKGR